MITFAGLSFGCTCASGVPFCSPPPCLVGPHLAALRAGISGPPLSVFLCFLWGFVLGRSRPGAEGLLEVIRSPSGAGPCPPVRVAPRVAAAVASLFPCPRLAAKLSLRNVGRCRVRDSSLVPRDSRTMRSVARRDPRDIRQRPQRAEPKEKTGKTNASGLGRSWSPYDCGSDISADCRVCAIPLRHSCGDFRPLRPCSKTDTNPLQPLAGSPLGFALCGRLAGATWRHRAFHAASR